MGESVFRAAVSGDLVALGGCGAFGWAEHCGIVCDAADHSGGGDGDLAGGSAAGDECFGQGIGLFLEADHASVDGETRHGLRL